jgi:hypothetical protein
MDYIEMTKECKLCRLANKHISNAKSLWSN